MLLNNLNNLIGNTDNYLLDQFLKGRINLDTKVLDAGCGSGRNLHILIENNIPFLALDQDLSIIKNLQESYSHLAESFIHSNLENFNLEDRKFDFIICNAVLHFARSHDHFELMFEALIKHLTNQGILFIRMTSNIGIENLVKEITSGVYNIPDGSERYLLTNNRLDALLVKHQLKLIDPFKSVVVNNMDLKKGGIRTMSTIVLSKK